MLRAHGLVRKVPKSHRYQLTKKGQITVTAQTAAQNLRATQRIWMLVTRIEQRRRGQLSQMEHLLVCRVWALPLFQNRTLEVGLCR